MKGKLVTVITLNWNGIELTEICLRSLKKNTVHKPIEVIVVDNGSRKDNVRKLENLKRTGFIDKLILNKQNKGFSGGNNQGFEVGKGNYFFMLNNDTEVTRNWLKNCLALAEKDKKIGAVGCKLVDKPQFEKKQYSIGPNRERKTTCGAAMLIPRHVIEEVGMLDAEHFSPIYGEETDWCYRVRHAGYKIMETDKSLVIHLGSHDTKKGKGRHAAYELLNRHRLKAMAFNLTIPEFLGHVPGLGLIFVNAAKGGLFVSLLKTYWSNLGNWREILRERRKRRARLF